MSMIPPGGPVSAQPQFAPPAYAPGYFAAPPDAPRPRTLGAVSMGLALAVFVLSMVASAYVGASAGPLSHRTATSFAFDSSNVSSAHSATIASIGILTVAQLVFGTVLGIVALVLGIVAAATKRGRAFGVVGIVVAALAPVLSFGLYIGALVATLPPA